jgi:hypothetical protein
VVVKTGRVLVALGLASALAVFVGTKSYQNDHENSAAKKLWLSLCEPSKLYESGTFENWNDAYEQIKTGKFRDSVHLIRPIENRKYENLWQVKGTDRVFVSRYAISFMESDSKMVIRDPKFRELDFWGGPLALPYRDHSCIYEKHKKLDEFLWN